MNFLRNLFSKKRSPGTTKGSTEVTSIDPGSNTDNEKQSLNTSRCPKCGSTNIHKETTTYVIDVYPPYGTGGQGPSYQEYNTVEEYLCDNCGNRWPIY